MTVNNAKCTDEEFLAIWKRHGGNARLVAAEIGVTERNVLARRRRLEGRLGEALHTESRNPLVAEIERSWTRRLGLEIDSGTVVVFSDAHYAVDGPTRAHRGMLKLIRELQPDVVIANGDILDGATISRHGPTGWQPQPTVKQELDAVTARMGEVADAARAARSRVKLMRTRGNHDSRFDIKLATSAPEYRGVHGMALRDHLPEWSESMSIMVNEGAKTPTMIKHRWHNGIHATYNNLLKGGINIVTGHLHRLKVEAWGDYRGRRYAVDTGTLAEITQDEFEYTEDNAVPWGSGFAVLTFHGGSLLPPELAEVMDPGLVFRGTFIEV